MRLIILIIGYILIAQGLHVSGFGGGSIALILTGLFLSNLAWAATAFLGARGVY